MASRAKYTAGDSRVIVAHGFLNIMETVRIHKISKFGKTTQTKEERLM